MADYRSRIHEHCPPELLLELQALVNKRSISDTNKKSVMVIELLKKYKVDYSNLGSGTNRIAVLIDGYVFKFALDKLGIKDNDSEFALSPELYPLVIKTYETNGLISVCEYVELISSYGEFQASRGKIVSRIAKIVEQDYLVGDVGFNSKNFCNWGKRTATGEFVILDFAYIYKLDPYKMRCQKCDAGIIEYDANYIDLVCQNCKRTVTFTEMRKMAITEEEEEDFIDDAKRRAVMLEGAVKTVEDKKKATQEVIAVVKDDKPKCREKRTMRDMWYKNDLTKYSRVDETIFDIIEEDKIPKEELHRDNCTDAYQESLEEMRRSREAEVRTDGSTGGTIRGVMNSNGRVSFVSVTEAPAPKPVVNTNRYNVSGKKPQPITQRPNNQRPQNNNNQKPKFEKPQPTIPQTQIAKNIIPEKVIVPDLTTGDTKMDVLLSMAATFASAFNHQLEEIKVQESTQEFEELEPEVIEEEAIIEVEPAESEAIPLSALYEPIPSHFIPAYNSSDDELDDDDDSEDEEEEDDEEYIGDDDIAIQVSADNAAIIKAALNNFESTKSTLLSPSKSTTFMKPKICPGDPNININ